VEVNSQVFNVAVARGVLDFNGKGCVEVFAGRQSCKKNLNLLVVFRIGELHSQRKVQEGNIVSLKGERERKKEKEREREKKEREREKKENELFEQPDQRTIHQ
jgi:hypothetical protein